MFLKSTSLLAFDNCYHYLFLFPSSICKGRTQRFLSVDSVNTHLYIIHKNTMSDQKQSRSRGKPIAVTNTAAMSIRG